MVAMTFYRACCLVCLLFLFLESSSYLIFRRRRSKAPFYAKPDPNLSTRRTFVGTTFVPAILVEASTAVTSRPQPAWAIFDSKERRQLEFCLVAVLRVLYWAEDVATTMSDADPITRSNKYLEARLGAKAILTGKIGGGATSRVVSLASLKLLECLDDLQYYYGATNSKVFEDLRQDWKESIAALVEFDGLDSLTDPSPRSSLVMTQFTDAKATFVRRMLTENIVPVSARIVNTFDRDAIHRSESYIRAYYSDEIPADYR